MNRRQKVITGGVVLGILGITGLALAAGGKKKQTCAAGMKWSERLGRCVPVECPVGFHREGGRIDGDCVADDDPEVKFCPVGTHWDEAKGECVADDDPTNCPPDQVYDLELASCRPRCPDGSRWSPEQQDCRPIDPGPGEETCPEGFHWVGPRFGMPGRCIADSPDPGDFADWIRNFPTDGAFYQVKQGDFPGWATSGMQPKSVVQNMFGSALMLAAREFGGLNNAASLAWANARRKSQAATNMLYNAMVCGAWNDMLYGTYGYCGPKGVAAKDCAPTARNHPGKHGRAIRFLKQHANNLARLEQGLAPARTVGLGSPANAGDAKSKAQGSASPGGKTSYPLLWLPGLDRQRLWESDGQDIRFNPELALPPDFIWDRGVENLSDANLQAYGCDPDDSDYRGRVEV